MSDSVLTLLRDKLVTDGATMGRLNADGLAEIQTLELPWRNNQRSISCIPTGTYEVRMTHSPKFGGLMPEITNVYGRSHILMHPARRAENVEGCVGTGEYRDATTPEDDIAGQVPAFGRLCAWLDRAFEKGRVLITITYADGSEA